MKQFDDLNDMAEGVLAVPAPENADRDEINTKTARSISMTHLNGRRCKLVRRSENMIEYKECNDKMKVPYTYLEVESIENDYDQQVPLHVISENVNREFHNCKKVRNVKSINYVIHKLRTDDEWRNRLEEKWLESVKV